MFTIAKANSIQSTIGFKNILSRGLKTVSHNNIKVNNQKLAKRNTECKFRKQIWPSEGELSCDDQSPISIRGKRTEEVTNESVVIGHESTEANSTSTNPEQKMAENGKATGRVR